ncbi:MAG: Arc family DNA-binding protein [Candidatus Aminicenantes bacterium]|nr:Arc family DNA-binding protein [Candidatus Aminicenantes bacterium]
MNEKKKFLLRLDAELYDALEKWAADDLRSVNAEMEFLLKEAVRKAGRLKSAGRPAQDPSARASKAEAG